jgi:hypothetical protein
MYQGHVRKGITKIVALLLVLSLFVGQVGMTGQTAFASQSEPAISSTGFSWCLVDESGNETQMVAASLQELVDTGIVRLSLDGLRFSFIDGRSRPGNCAGTPPPATETPTAEPTAEPTTPVGTETPTPTADFPEISAIILDCSGLVTFSVTNASSNEDWTANIRIVKNDPEMGVIDVGDTTFIPLTTGQSDYVYQLNTTDWATDVPIFAKGFTHDFQVTTDSEVIDCGGSTETPEPTIPVGTETPTTEPTTEPTEIPSTGTPSVTPTSSATVTTTATATITPTPKPRIAVTPKNVKPGQDVDISVTNFDANELVRVRWKVGATWVQVGVIATDGSGAGTVSATVPSNVAAGANSVRADGANLAQQTNTVVVTIPATPTVTPTPKPRISVTPKDVVPGQRVDVSVTNFGASESVRVRWKVGSTWVQVGVITTDGSGAGAVSATVPANVAAGANSVRADGAKLAQQTNTVVVTIPGPPTAALSTTRSTVNAGVSFTVEHFLPGSTISITWRRPGGSTVSLGTVTADSSGEAAGSFVVPATEGGSANRVIFASGASTVSTAFDVAPRINVIPATVSRGQVVEVSLRGYGKQETVRIRWMVNGSWVTVATITTSNTGSANVNVTVPANATLGQNSVRGDGAVFRQQTNAVTVVP